MLKHLISQGNFAIWPQLSLVIFTLTFIGVLIWVCRRKNGDHYRRMANLVIEEATTERGEDHE